MNLSNLIKEQLSEAVISSLVSKTGESNSGITKAISALIPTIIGGLANGSKKTDVLDAITKTDLNPNLGDLLDKTSENSTINNLVTSIFGDKLNGILNSVASFSGISENSVSSLLNVVTGASIESIGKYATENKLDSTGISNLLGNQKGFLASLLPEGFGLASLGFGGVFEGLTGSIGNVTGAATNLISNISGNASDGVGAVAENVNKAKASITGSINKTTKKNNNSFFKWLISLLFLGFLSFLAIKQYCAYASKCQKTSTEVSASAVSPVITDSLATTTIEKVSTELTLPSGNKINAFVGGIEDQTISFLQSDEYKNATPETLKEKWFSFDNVNFEFGTTKLTNESLVQIENLRAILNEFKDAKIKIGAYSDKKGDDASNLKISQSRAEVIKNSINSSQVTGAEGYGEQFAKIDENASDEERESDRKISIRFEKNKF